MWNYQKVSELFDLPFVDLFYRAQAVHREHKMAGKMQLSTLLSIKTGSCPEDCAYCPQSARYKTNIKKHALMNADEIIEKAKCAKVNGATRFCMGAAWRDMPDRELHKIAKIIKAIKDLGLETCVTLGMLSKKQADILKEAGLDYYNHNLDTSPEYYKKIISTRNYDERLSTLKNIRDAQLKICCGGILGMGESRADRINFLLQLTHLPEPPESLPINRLIPIKGTPLADAPSIDNFEFIRTIAVARIMLPTSVIRLSAGRNEMSEETHALCFMVGVSSIHFGEVLLTTTNPTSNKDLNLLKKLGITPTC